MDTRSPYVDIESDSEMLTNPAFRLVINCTPVGGLFDMFREDIIIQHVSNDRRNIVSTEEDGVTTIRFNMFADRIGKYIGVVMFPGDDAKYLAELYIDEANVWKPQQLSVKRRTK